MNVHFFPASLPAKGIITNLTICQSDGGELRAHCYFNFHFPNCSKTELPVIVFSMNCFCIHCLPIHGITYLIFSLFCRNSLYFIEIVHSSYIYYANVFPNLLFKF